MLYWHDWIDFDIPTLFNDIQTILLFFFYCYSVISYAYIYTSLRGSITIIIIIINIKDS